MSALPPEAATAADVSRRDERLVGPDGTVVGKVFRRGIAAGGRTRVADHLQASLTLRHAIGPSAAAVLNAVAENEGRLEAVNTWDAAFLSFGVCQWTAGTGDGPGELGWLLNRLHTADARAFDALFGRHGLTPDGTPSRGAAPAMHLALDGVRLDAGAKEERLRTDLWAYRFWRAGHHPIVRDLQIILQIERLRAFWTAPAAALGKRPPSAFVTSELGVALLLDQHINRPGAVVATLADAIESTGGANEAALLAAYCTERTRTSMTDAARREERLRNAVRRGALSQAPGSFALAALPA